MVNLECLDNKRFVFRCLELLKENRKLNEAEVGILTSKNDCKRLFCFSKYSILLEAPLTGALENVYCYDQHGKQRYYKEKIYTCGKAYIVSNHWYGPNKSLPDNRTPFQTWVLGKLSN